jgi:osmotically-inducible protein OsmY
MHKPNNLLELDTQDALDWDPQIDDSRIVVSAKDGRVTLTGSVPTLYQSMRAADDVQTVGGVTGLDNQLLVGLVGAAMNDGDMAVAAAAALDDDRFVPKGAVSADVLDGYVTLHGEVRHHYQRQAAEHAVSKVDGVRGVDDNVTLTTEPIPTDVADRINKAFQRSAIIDDSLITVSNDGPTIYLDGKVGSWNAKQEAEDTAWDAPGVTQVIDRLVIVA